MGVTEDRENKYMTRLMLAVLLLGAVLGLLSQCGPRPAYAHLTDPQGCELLVVKQPDKKTALTAGLSDDHTVFNYGFDTNQDGKVDLIVGYQVTPHAQWDNRVPGYLPNPVVYWKDSDGDGAMDHLFVPVGGQYDDCRLYIHQVWDGKQWVVVSPHPEVTAEVPAPR